MDQPPKRGRGRPRKPKAPKPEGRNGRPIDQEQRIFAMWAWYLYRDRMPRMELKGAIAEAIGKDVSRVGKLIAGFERRAKKKRLCMLIDPKTRNLIGMEHHEFLQLSARIKAGHPDPLSGMGFSAMIF